MGRDTINFDITYIIFDNRTYATNIFYMQYNMVLFLFPVTVANADKMYMIILL